MSQVRSHFSRRNMLIGLAGGAAATAGVVVTSGFAESAASLLRPIGGGEQGVALRSAGYREWSAQVGSSFTTQSGHVLRLVDVQGFPHRGRRPSNLRDQAFVARFDIAKGGELKEDVYRVAHPEGGKFDMFLTRDSADKPQRMAAVFG